jgi:formylmethanofuran dehydrogenase subunit E
MMVDLKFNRIRRFPSLWNASRAFCFVGRLQFKSRAGRRLNAPGADFFKMNSLDEYLREAEHAHGHLCAGQVLGVRLAMLGLSKLKIEDPRGKDRKRLVTFVEIDRCATDAVGVVTGCRLGKRALKFRDWGKMAATFVDVSTGKAIRIAAKESSKTLARQMHPELESKNQQQMLAYREMSDHDLFTTQWVKVDLPPEEFPGYKGERIVCESCGEGINFRREVKQAGKLLCRACAGETYYEPL